jgi:hypothetical protein
MTGNLSIKIGCFVKTSGRGKVDIGGGYSSPYYSTRNGGYIYMPSSPVGERSADKVLLKIRGDSYDKLEVQTRSGSPAKACSEGSTRAKVEIRRASGGVSSGIRNVQLECKISTGQENHTEQLDVLIAVKPKHLDTELFKLMVEEVGAWLSASLIGGIRYGVEYGSGEQIFENASFSLKYLESRLNRFKRLYRRIRESPILKKEKRYFKTNKKAKRKDGTTMLMDLKSVPPGEYTYRIEKRHDCYENRLLIEPLKIITGCLRRIEAMIKETKSHLNSRKIEEESFENDEEVEYIGEKEEELKEKSDKVDKMRNDIVSIRSDKFFSNISKAGIGKMKFPASVTEDERYMGISDIVIELREDKSYKLVSNIQSFENSDFTFGNKRTREIFEYWTFYAVVESLSSIGYSTKEQSIEDKIASSPHMEPHLLPGSSIDLSSSKRRPKSLSVYYEKSFYGENGGIKAKPDITVVNSNEYITDEEKQKLPIDAKCWPKYKNIDSKNYEDVLKEGHLETLRDQYQPPKFSSKREGISGSQGCILLYPGTENDGFVSTSIEEVGRGGKNKSVLPVSPGNTSFLRERIDHIIKTRF